MSKFETSSKFSYSNVQNIRSFVDGARDIREFRWLFDRSVSFGVQLRFTMVSLIRILYLGHLKYRVTL